MSIPIDKTSISVATFNRRAEEYQDKYMDVSLYTESLELFCGHIKKQGAAILELGCGPGNIIQYLLRRRPDLKILGIDLAPRMLELAKVNNPAAQFQQLDCRKITQLATSYDAFLCGFCLPYLSKEETEQLIADAAKMLTSKGIIYISTMEGAYEKSGIQFSSYGDHAYIHYYEAEYLTGILEKNGFALLDLSRKTYTPADGTETVDLLIVAEKTV